MKLCSPDELNKIPFTLHGISAIRQTPGYPSLEVAGRAENGFMLVERGWSIYEWGNRRVKLQPGACIYLPYGSYHRMVEHSEEYTIIRVHFSLLDPQGKRLIFSAEPMPVCLVPDPVVSEIIHRLAELFMNAETILLRKACVYELLDRMVWLQSNDRRDPIRQVVSYIREHYTEEINCKELAQICLMSPANMYRRFRDAVGCTPTEYKNRLRISQAKSMLRNDTISIGEISALMGYDDTAYFCKLFKRETGKTPLRWRKEI